MTESERERLRRLIAEATPGKWWSPVCAPFAGTWQAGQILDHTARPLTSRSDADLACEAARTLPSLLAALDAAEARVKALAETVLLFVGDMEGVALRFDLHAQLRALRHPALSPPRADAKETP